MCIIAVIYKAENVQHYVSLPIFQSLNFEQHKPACNCATRDKTTPLQLEQLGVTHPGSSRGSLPTGTAFLGERTYLQQLETRRGTQVTALGWLTRVPAAIHSGCEHPGCAQSERHEHAFLCSPSAAALPLLVNI